MTPKLARCAGVVTTTMLVLCCTDAWAQSVQSIYSPVILVRDRTSERTSPDARPIQMGEDGAAFARIVSLGNDLSHTGGAGGRYMLGGQTYPGVLMPDESPYVDLVRWHENGDATTLKVLTVDRSLSRGWVQWSADSTRVFYGGRRYNDAGAVIESGLYVGEVEWLGGVPERVYDEHLVASDIPAQHLTVTGGAIDADGRRVAFTMTREVFDENGQHVRWETAGLYVTATPRQSEGSVAPPQDPVRLLLTTGEGERGVAAFSPVAGDHRLLYGERDARIVYVTYIWSVDVPMDYDGRDPLLPRAVTTRTNSSANYYLNGTSWSPTGSFVVFAAAKTTWWPDSHVYKIRADGTGKAIRLTAKADAYTNPFWRP